MFCFYVFIVKIKIRITIYFFHSLQNYFQIWLLLDLCTNCCYQFPMMFCLIIVIYKFSTNIKTICYVPITKSYTKLTKMPLKNKYVSCFMKIKINKKELTCSCTIFDMMFVMFHVFISFYFINKIFNLKCSFVFLFVFKFLRCRRQSFIFKFFVFL